MEEYYIAWWNLENLFDVENSTQRPAWLQKNLKKELSGWNQEILDKKIQQLFSIIKQINKPKGPDLLGVCEVENKPVMQQLMDSLQPLGRNYGIAHHDTQDERGIDVGYIYDQDRFDAGDQFSHIILKRTATRDLFQVNFKTKSGRDLIIVGNHWPSRTSGEWETEPYRILAGETLSYWHKRILEEKGDDVAILVMGDFNDEPPSRSVTQYALSTSCKMKVKKSTDAPRLFNLMWTEMGKGVGTLYYDNFPLLFDQFLVSKGMVKVDASIRVKSDSVKIERFTEMISGTYEVPKRFGRPSGELDKEGFSDHFPISLVLEEI